jgi:hypothetical protein
VSKKRKKQPAEARGGQREAPLPAHEESHSIETLEVEGVPDIAHFFRPEDWWAAVATFVLSSLIFWYHMAPEVTLQDSGELVTGAFSFGVPHPPGYPLWAFLGYFWSHLIVPFGNPAWRIGLMSVFTGEIGRAHV